MSHLDDEGSEGLGSRFLCHLRSQINHQELKHGEPLPLLLTVKMAAQLLGVAPGTIRNLMAAGKLTKVKLTDSIKGQVYVNSAEVQALATTPAPAPAEGPAPAPVEPDPTVQAAAVLRAKLAAANAERKMLGLEPVTFDDIIGGSSTIRKFVKRAPRQFAPRSPHHGNDPFPSLGPQTKLGPG